MSFKLVSFLHLLLFTLKLRSDYFSNTVSAIWASLSSYTNTGERRQKSNRQKAYYCSKAKINRSIMTIYKMKLLNLSNQRKANSTRNFNPLYII